QTGSAGRPPGHPGRPAGMPRVLQSSSLSCGQRSIRQRLEAGAAPEFKHVAVRILKVDVYLAALLDPRSVVPHAVALQICQGGISIFEIDVEHDMLPAAAFEPDASCRG